MKKFIEEFFLRVLDLMDVFGDQFENFVDQFVHMFLHLIGWKYL